MSNLITCSFAFKKGFKTSLQLNTDAGDTTTEMYLKNIFVSLKSARLHNPDDTVMICSNVELSDEWKARFEESDIEVRLLPFDSFLIDKEFSWALAYYKLCVMKTLVDEGRYEKILLMDADTFTTQSYSDLWKECDFGVLMYPLGHTFSHYDRESIRKDFIKLYPQESAKRSIVHLGGEFVAGNLQNLRKLMAMCEKVFAQMQLENFAVAVNAGDETIWSIAATLIREELEIITASPYLFRFWTQDFYLVSTVTVNNPVCIWHLPQEKPTGILRLYRYYMKKHEFPKVEKAAQMLGILKAKRPFNIYTFDNKVRGKLKLKL